MRSTRPLVIVMVTAAVLGCSRAGAGGETASTEAAVTAAVTAASAATDVPRTGTSGPVGTSTTSTRPAPSTTAGPYTETGVKQPLSGGGTVAVRSSQPTATPKGVPPPPTGSLYAVVVATFCATPAAPMTDLDPARFRVEVGGQGYVGHSGGEPPIGRLPLTTGTTVNAGTCLDATVSFVIAGELHIETVAYDTSTGPLRWAA